MKKVKYYLPDIEVKCISTYCRNGEIATIVKSIDNYKRVHIKYADGTINTARIGYANNYDIEFVHERDELLQEAMELYDGKSFTSLVDEKFENFKPIKAKWNDSYKHNIILYDKDERSAFVYELGDWSENWAEIKSSETQHVPKYKVEDKINIINYKDRSKTAYCNVDPSTNDYLGFHNGWKIDSRCVYIILDVCYSKQNSEYYYKIDGMSWYSESSIVPVFTPSSELPDAFTFPIEGQCKSITPELLEYLRKAKTPEGDQSLKDRAKAVCWNNKGYWFVSRSSAKKEYTINYLEQFFTQIPKQEKPMPPQAQQFDYTPQGGFQLTLPPELLSSALQQVTESHFRESEKKFTKHREDVTALIDKKKQMIETELYEKVEKTISCDFVEFKTKVIEDYLTSKQIVIELGQDKKYEFSLEDKHEQLPKMVTFLQLFKQAMIVGPSGSGKSTMAKQAAEVMSLRYGAFSCNLEASKSELVGFANIDGYVESSFLDFYENGGVFLIDEYDSMSPSIAVVLNAAFDRTGMIAVPNRKGKTIAKKHKDFYCILAGNTWGSGSVEYQGREMQDAAFLDRFKMCRIFIDYDEKLEKNIAGKHHDFFKKVRDYVTKKVDGENFSTRSMYDATVLLNNGFTQEDILTMMSEHWDEALHQDLVTAVL
jgi:energy-coupling factor transporter ATP-binding protein EcfA2